jgi:hypothetical protein
VCLYDGRRKREKRVQAKCYIAEACATCAGVPMPVAASTDERATAAPLPDPGLLIRVTPLAALSRAAPDTGAV